MENIAKVVEKNKRITPNILTKYEYVNIINTRAQQISSDVEYQKNPKIFIDISKLDNSRLHDSIYIATEEFKQHKIPFIITRFIGDTKVEYWNLIDDNMVYMDD
jgi:DNA-directed RNA polymerase I, II, and III subunit RPABC2